MADRNPGEAADAPPAQTCVTCGTALLGPWCHACGERVVSAADLRVPAFARSVAAGAFDLDSRLWRTFRELLRRPGLLTAEFMRGRRRPYLHPLQTFLLANLLMFAALASVGGFSTFTTPLRYHVTGPLYGPSAARLIERHGAPGTAEAAEYARRFDEAAPRYANSLVIVVVPIFATLLVLLQPRRRRPFVEHLVMALHFLAFLLLVLTVLPFLVTALVRLVPALTPVTASEVPISILLLTICTIYLAMAFRRAYEQGAVPAVLRGVAAAMLILPAIMTYRAFLFFAVYLTLD